MSTNPSVLREELNRLDDVELDALALDHFPKVYDKFSVGLRRDVKINLLLEHCRRFPDDARQLESLLPLSKGNNNNQNNSIEVAIRLISDTFPTAYCYHLDSSSYPFVKCTIQNHQAIEIKVRAKIVIENCSDFAVKTITIPPSQTADCLLLPVLRQDYIRTLNEIRKATLHVTIDLVLPHEETITDNTYTIYLQARDVATIAVRGSDGTIIDLSHLLATLVTPHYLGVERLRIPVQADQ